MNQRTSNPLAHDWPVLSLSLWVPQKVMTIQSSSAVLRVEEGTSGSASQQERSQVAEGQFCVSPGDVGHITGLTRHLPSTSVSVMPWGSYAN